MKRVYKSFVVIMFLVFFSFCVFSSCSPYRELKNVSKGLSCYNIDANIDSENMVVSAKEKVKVVNRTKSILTELAFNLYGRAFRENANVHPWTNLNEGKCFPNGVNYGDIIIKEVKQNNETSEFEYFGEDDNALKIKLKEKLEPKESVNIEINFELKLTECIHRLGYFGNNISLGNWFPILAMYENGEFIVEPYYSTGDPFYSDIANYNVNITYPSDYKLFATGVEKDKKINNNQHKAQIKALAVRDFAVNLTKESLVKKCEYEDIIIRYVGYTDDKNIDYLLSVAKKAVKFFSETFGKYPYETLDVVKAPFIHGGMEYPSLVIISENITDEFDLAKVIVHEIAHQWWYAVVGNNEITEAWLDESLAEYTTILFFEKHKEFDVTYEELVSESFANYTLFADIVSSLNKKINTSMLLKVDEYVSEYEYSYMIYVRGVLMFDSINQVIGTNRLVNGLKKYYKTYKFKIATTDDLIASLEKTSRKNIGGLMDSWLNGKTVVGKI